jgi:hypothetical protein
MSHTLSIDFNNAATNDPCAICAVPTDPIIGPEVFIAGTGALVCRDCTADNDVDLYHELCRQHSLLALAGKVDHGTPLIDGVTALELSLR